MARFQNETRRRLRRGLPIHAFVGPNGSGKSACCVWDTMPSLAAGRLVLSTVRLLDWENPRPCDDPTCLHPEHAAAQALPLIGGDPVSPVIRHRAAHPCYVPLRDWEQLLDAEHCDLLLDEVTGVASSRESAGMPAPVANKLVQLRRADVVVRWTAPNWARADKIIRECSQAVTYCQGYMPVSAEDEDRLWRQRRLFRWKTYDAADFEDFTVGKREQLRPMVRDWHWGPGSPVFDAYDTLDAVESIGTVTDSGRCYRCGGRRRVPECKCDQRHAASPSADAGVPSGVAGAPGRRRAPDSPSLVS